MEGVAHLQAAAREAIEALRALLDVAEDLVEDPAAVQAIAGAVGSAVGETLERLRSGAAGAEGPGGEPTDEDPRVQRIHVS